MADVVIELSESSWREPWTRSVTVSAPDATKVAEWLNKVLPELIAHAKSGDFARFGAYVKD